MTKSISVGELRQNPTDAINDIAENREPYEVTKHGRAVARLVPIEDGMAIDNVSGLTSAMAESLAEENLPSTQPRRKGVSPKEARRSTLYRREQSAQSRQKLLDLFNEGRDRSGNVGE